MLRFRCARDEVGPVFVGIGFGVVGVLLVCAVRGRTVGNELGSLLRILEHRIDVIKLEFGVADDVGVRFWAYSKTWRSVETSTYHDNHFAQFSSYLSCIAFTLNCVLCSNFRLCGRFWGLSMHLPVYSNMRGISGPAAHQLQLPIPPD